MAQITPGFEQPSTSLSVGQDDFNWWHGSQARVFISCGQRGAEAQVAERIRDGLRASNFCPYLAIAAHSSNSLTSEIYRRLRTAEYFLFVDFRRDKIGRWGRARYRGSLFSNQELSIASYLGTEILPFLEEGIDREGILAHIQGNSVPFSRKEDLVDKVLRNVVEQRWDSSSRREITFRRDPAQYEEALWPDGSVARYFHVGLVNGHRNQVANDCRVFLSQGTNLSTGVVSKPDPVELKFKHVTSPLVSVVPDRPREFDAIIINHERPSVATAGVVNPIAVDSGRAVYEHTFMGPGEFELEFEAWSREFPKAVARAKLTLGRFISDARLILL